MVAIDRISRTDASSDGTGGTSSVGGTDKLPWQVKYFLIAMMIPVGFNLGPIALDVVRLLLLVVIVPLFVQLISGKCGKLYLVDYMFFAHIMWAGLSVFVNHPDIAVQNAGITTVEFIGAYLVGRVCIRNKAQFVSLCKWAAGLVIITLPFAMLETQTGRPIILDTIRGLPGLRSHYDVHHDPRMGLLRAQVVFIHPIHYGLFCSVALPLVYVGLRNVLTMPKRLMVTGLVALCCFLSLSSGAILAMVLQVFLVGWAITFQKTEKRWLYLSILFATLYVLIDLLSNRTPLQVFMTYATFSPHTAYWRGIILEWGIMNIFGNAENNVVGAPFFGHGLFDWQRPWFMYSGSMDNFWLVLAVRYGMPALILFLAGFVPTLFKIGWRDFRGDPVLLDIRRAWMFLFVGMSFTLATVHIWSAMYSYVLFMFGAGMWMLSATPGGDRGSAPEDDDPTPGSRYTRFARPGPSTKTTRAARPRLPRGMPARGPRPAQASRALSPEPRPETGPAKALSSARSSRTARP